MSVRSSPTLQTRPTTAEDTTSRTRHRMRAAGSQLRTDVPGPVPALPANRGSQCVPAGGVEATRVCERAALTTIRRQAFTVPGVTRVGTSGAPADQ
ncbi:hypothetical protein Pd630_LPD13092 (plasmid) [Rhodococcus opacus PD630]|nr:hypothetical protein Pd630_LPD13092 [Rhodococcus opacus PD630]